MTGESQAALDDFDEALRLAADASAEFQYEVALRQVLVAVRLAEDKYDSLRQSRAHAEHARLLSKLGLFAEAISTSHIALRLAEGDPASAARALGALGSAHQALSSPEVGLQIYESMLAKAREANEATLEAHAHRGLCAVNLIQHRLGIMNGEQADEPEVQGYAGTALKHALEAVAISEDTGDMQGQLLGRHLQAGSLMAAGDLIQARRANENLLKTIANCGLRHADQYQAITLKLLGRIGLREQDVAVAEERTLQALLLFERQGDLPQASDCFKTLSDISERKGDYKAALDWQRRRFDGVTRFASSAARAHAAAMEVREGAQHARVLAGQQQERADRLERSNLDLSREAEWLGRSALEDSLTGIANRRRLDQELTTLIADRRGRRHCSLALLDIDHFKQVNDRFLHTTGDKVLARIGAILRQCSREKDLVARYGGEEFAIVFVNVTAEDVALACERVRQAVASAGWSDFNSELTVTASIGFCHFDEVGDNLEELIRLADDRLFQAKRAGRNRVTGPLKPYRPTEE